MHHGYISLIFVVFFEWNFPVTQTLTSKPIQSTLFSDFNFKLLTSNSACEKKVLCIQKCRYRSPWLMTTYHVEYFTNYSNLFEHKKNNADNLISGASRAKFKIFPGTVPPGRAHSAPKPPANMRRQCVPANRSFESD